VLEPLHRVLDMARDRAAAAASARTVRELATEYVDKHCKPHQRRWRDTELRLHNHVLPTLGDKKVGALRRAEVVELLDRLEHEYAATAAIASRRCRAHAHECFPSRYVMLQTSSSRSLVASPRVQNSALHFGEDQPRLEPADTPRHGREQDKGSATLLHDIVHNGEPETAASAER
jgi:hypothetical protein